MNGERYTLAIMQQEVYSILVIQKLKWNNALTYSSHGDEQCSAQLFSQHSLLENLTFCNNTDEQLNIKKIELVL